MSIQSIRFASYSHPSARSLNFESLPESQAKCKPHRIETIDLTHPYQGAQDIAIYGDLTATVSRRLVENHIEALASGKLTLPSEKVGYSAAALNAIYEQRLKRSGLERNTPLSAERTKEFTIALANEEKAKRTSLPRRPYRDFVPAHRAKIWSDDQPIKQQSGDTTASPHEQHGEGQPPAQTSLTDKHAQHDSGTKSPGENPIPETTPGTSIGSEGQ
jgi:hypothetical protein